MNHNGNNEHLGSDSFSESKFDLLVHMYLEGTIDTQSAAVLKKYLYNPDYITRFIERCKQDQLMYELLSSDLRRNTEMSGLLDFNLWHEFAKYEEFAPGIKSEEPMPERGLIQKVEHSKVKSKVNRFSLYSLLVSSAALIFVIVYAHFISMRHGIEVATLADSMNAKWADITGPMAKGTRMATGNERFLLREGYAKLRFDNQTQVTFEGPAEFQILAEDRIGLGYGKMYTRVPKEAIGFSVYTHNAKIIDMGTEFGVISDTSGDTEVHVFKGKTVLVGGGQKDKKSILNLTAGNAGIVSDNGATIKEIQHAPHAFIQEIDSRSGFVWKGESTILLSNLLSGHIFSADPEGIEIDPAIGEYVIHENYVSGTERQGGIEYQKMDSPFVDGSFIPQGQQQIISSTNLTWQFPKTNGSLHYNLSDRKTIYDGYTATRYALFLTPVHQEKSSLLFHPNMGITFDLNKIREQIPTLQIQRFVTDCGIAFSVREALKKAYPDGNIPDEEKPSVDFTVLLDGKVRETLIGIHLDSGTRKIDVEIHPTDRFLTLVSTDGNQSYIYDWFVLAQPELKIEVAESTSIENKNMNP